VGDGVGPGADHSLVDRVELVGPLGVDVGEVGSSRPATFSEAGRRPGRMVASSAGNPEASRAALPAATMASTERALASVM
jgi:hypothetical protein